MESSLQPNFQLCCERFIALNQTFESINQRGLTASDVRIRAIGTGLVIGFKNYSGLTPSRSIAKFPQKMVELRNDFFEAYKEFEEASRFGEDLSFVRYIIKDLRNTIESAESKYLYLENEKNFNALKKEFIEKIDSTLELRPLPSLPVSLPSKSFIEFPDLKVSQSYFQEVTCENFKHRETHPITFKIYKSLIMAVNHHTKLGDFKFENKIINFLECPDDANIKSLTEYFLQQFYANRLYTIKNKICYFCPILTGFLVNLYHTKVVYVETESIQKYLKIEEIKEEGKKFELRTGLPLYPINYKFLVESFGEDYTINFLKNPSVKDAHTISNFIKNSHIIYTTHYCNSLIILVNGLHPHAIFFQINNI